MSSWLKLLYYMMINKGVMPANDRDTSMVRLCLPFSITQDWAEKAINAILRNLAYELGLPINFKGKIKITDYSFCTFSSKNLLVDKKSKTTPTKNFKNGLSGRVVEKSIV